MSSHWVTPPTQPLHACRPDGHNSLPTTRTWSASSTATSSGFEDKAVSKAGKVIGYDVLNITVDPKTGKVSAWVTLDTAGGLLYGTLKVSRNPVTNGTVTDGTAPRHQKKPAGMGPAGRPAPAL